MGISLNTKRVNTRKIRGGFGIVEVLVSAVILGFLLVALLNLQSGNRESLLRVRARDGAVAVAQEMIDSLSALGLASLSNAALIGEECEEDESTEAIECPPKNCNETGGLVVCTFPKSRTWKGSPGPVPYDVTEDYTAEVTISDDTDYESTETSHFKNETHLYAKRLDVRVSWKFKQSTQSIRMTGVVR